MNSLIWLLKTENQTFENLFIRIREKMADVLEETGLDYSISIPEGSNNWFVSHDACRDIFLIVKEAVNNAIRHSRGTGVHVDIQFVDTHLVISVANNGIGYNPIGCKSGGNGMSNIKTRIENLGGVLEVFSPNDNGTHMLVKLPFDRLLMR
jgi:signal transduction histidine kinase